MSCRRLWILFAAISLVIPNGSPATEKCLYPNPHPIDVRPARPWKGPDDPLKVAVVLLRDYLSLAKTPKGENVVSVDVASEGASQFRAGAQLGEKRHEAPFAFSDARPITLNEALIGLTERLTKEMKVPISGKKVRPFLNETASARAYLRYADGALALENVPSAAGLERAKAAFEEAIQADYNYTFAYAGLAEAEAQEVALTGSETARMKAKVAMEKAKLLNPYRAKMREKRYHWYLKAQCPEGRGN